MSLHVVIISHIVLTLAPLSSTENFLANRSVEGGRASAAAAGTYRDDNVSDDDNDDESEEGEEEIESDLEDEDDNETRTMPTKTKGSTGKKQAAAPPAAAAAESKKSHVDGELQVLQKRYGKMGIRDDNHVGYDFTVKFPYFWFKFTHDSCQYLQFEMLLPTTHPDDLSCTISKDGMQVFVKSKLPSSLLDPRIWQRRHNIPDNVLGDHLLYQGGKDASTYIMDSIDEVVLPFMVIPLPMQCQTSFCDPYRIDDRGIYFNYYPHPSYPRMARPQDLNDAAAVVAYFEHLETNAHRVCIASLTLKSFVLPKTPRGVEVQQPINW